MNKRDALKKGIFWKCHQCEDYSKLNINSKINLKSEIAYYWSETRGIFNVYKETYLNNFHKHIKPIFQKLEDTIEDFSFQEYLFSVGL